MIKLDWNIRKWLKMDGTGLIAKINRRNVCVCGHLKTFWTCATPATVPFAPLLQSWSSQLLCAVLQLSQQIQHSPLEVLFREDCPEHPLQCKKLQETEETWRNRFRFQNFGNKQCLGQFRNVQNLEVESGFEHQSEVQWKRSTAFSTSWPISTWGDHRSCLVGLPVLFEPLTYWSKEKSPRDLRQALRP